MATKIKDSATAQRAALNVNTGIEQAAKEGEPITPKEKTTTERLFPDFVTDDGGIVNRPIRSKDPLPVADTPPVAVQDQTPVPPVPTAPTYLKPEELAGKMVRLKVDGIEQDVPAESLIKTNQLERHLNAQLMEVAREKRMMEEERQKMRLQPELPKPPKQEPSAKKSPEIEALESRLAQMEQERMQERELMRPAIQEAGIKRVEQMAKERLGTDDFRTYFDRIKETALSEAQKAQLAGDVQSAKYFDSDAFYFQKYQEMKLKDLMSKPQAPVPTPTNPNAPVLQTQQGAPVVVTNSGQPVNIPTFEPSGGVPSRMNPDANWQGTYNTLLKRAQESNTDENWMAVMRHKFNRDNS